MAAICSRAGGLLASQVRLGRSVNSIRTSKPAQSFRSKATLRGTVRMATTANLFTSFSAKKIGSGTLAAPVDGELVDFSAYAGKVIMVQNVASL
mmetsp:Transcript_21335/g.35744  ORF Transcript_21335/g.35744 Transcript_21335/m.35744 type:complete len:94 (+) Transcript_21335:74-355(+)